MDMDESVVIVGGEGNIRRLNGNGKNSIKKSLCTSLRAKEG